MRNKQRMSQAQAAQNAKAIAAARSMAAAAINAPSSTSPTDGPNSRMRRSFKGQSRQQAELNPQLQQSTPASMTMPAR